MRPVAYPVRILASGRYLPAREVTSAEIDSRLGLEPGTSARVSGVKTRYYADGEGASDMGAAAIRDALANAALGLEDLDLILCVSGTPEQPIPCNASLVQKKLGSGAAGIPSFDVGATCMGFIVGLDVAGSLLTSGRFRRAVIVAADIASLGLNAREPEAYALFGDAAAAVIVERSDEATASSRVLGVRYETYAEGAGLTEIRGGGSALPAYRYTPERADDYLFHMEGPRVFREAARVFPRLFEQLLSDLGLGTADVDLVVPHQASDSALELMRRRLGFEASRWVRTVQKFGNTIASSIPLALDDSLREGRIRRGMRLAFAGTAAGFAASAAIVDF